MFDVIVNVTLIVEHLIQIKIEQRIKLMRV